MGIKPATRQATARVCLWILIFGSGFLAGRFLDQPSPIIIARPSSANGAADLDDSALLKKRRASASIQTDEFAVLVVDRRGTLSSSEVELAAQKTVNQLLTLQQQRLMRELAAIGAPHHDPSRSGR